MKNQNEFLEALEEELRFLKAKEIHEILKHYRDKISTEIDYGTPEEKVISNLPLPKDIANEIYKSKGISYLEIQKKKYRQKEILKAILSGAIIVLMLVLSISCLSFFVISSIEFNKLLGELPSFTTYLDKILIPLLVILLDITLISIILFVIDLFYIIISSFLVNILRAFKKTYRVHYKFQDFSITGSLKKLAKKKNVVAIVLAGSATLSLIVFGASLFSKGYIYRSINNDPNNEIIEEYDNNLKEINIQGNDAKVIFQIDEKLTKIKVEYKYEFSNLFTKDYKDQSLTITNIGSKKFGLFGLLDEPSPSITITLPNTSYLENININLYDGELHLNKLDNTKLDVKADIKNNCNIYVYCCKLNKLETSGYKTVIKVANLDEKNELILPNEDIIDINSVDIKSSTGEIYIGGINTTSLTINNTNAKTRIMNCYLDSFVFKTIGGDTYIDEIVSDDITYSSQSSINGLEVIQCNTIILSAEKAGVIDVTRLMCTGKVELSAYTGGTITISRVKAKEIQLTPSPDDEGNEKEVPIITGTVILNYVNTPEEIKDHDTAKVASLKNMFNSFVIESSLIFGKSAGEVHINRSNIDTLNLYHTSSALKVAYTNINGNAKFHLDTDKSVIFNDVFGTDIHFLLKHTKLQYFVDKEDTENIGKIAKFYYKFDGVNHGIDTNVERELEPNEQNG